jgi:hypothetical protein
MFAIRPTYPGDSVSDFRLKRILTPTTGTAMKLIVLNLPRDFTEDVHGDIKACDLVLDEITGQSKGFGFVEMALEHEAEIVIKALQGSKLNKNTIRVKLAN